MTVLVAPALAQGKPTAKRPDLEGVWSNQSLTNLSRQPGTKLSVTEQEAKDLVENNPWVLLAASEEGASDFGDDLLDDGNSDRGYNTFWIDPGQSLARVKGEIRTSWLVEPADGRVPVSPAGLKARSDAAARKRATMYEGPETLPIAERCYQCWRAGHVEHDLQQQLSDRAGAGSCDDPRRDGARCAYHPDREEPFGSEAQADRDPAMARRFRWLV
jgi:hypothetical protein